MTRSCKRSHGGVGRALALGVCLLAAACTNRIGDFTLVSTKNVDLSDASVDVKKGRRVTGEDCRYIVLFFPLGEPSLREAVDDALEKGNGTLLVDEVTSVRSWYVPLIFGESCFIAEGTVVDVVARARPASPVAQTGAVASP